MARFFFLNIGQPARFVRPFGSTRSRSELHAKTYAHHTAIRDYEEPKGGVLLAITNASTNKKVDALSNEPLITLVESVSS